MAIIAARSVVLSLSLACLAFTGSPSPARQETNPSLTAHEWGTFTSIADRSGQAVKWHPISGPYEIPSFVEHLRSASTKPGLEGTIRMETPVLYFYAPHETEVSVGVHFSRGLITEWYPHVSHIEPSQKADLRSSALYDHPSDGSITWNSISIEPGLAANLPRDATDSHYYAAREVSAAPILVRTNKGTQQEKFLFYRGVATFPVPIAAEYTSDNRLLVKNLGANEISGVILLERHGDQFGYRLGGSLQTGMQLDPPELNSDIESLSRDLERVLTAQGLYVDEARAMIATWRHSWFEEGTRLLYLVPRHFVDSVLPLSIHPAPGQLTRVFVGRLELISPTTEKTVLVALDTHDVRTILKYGRFLEPILDQLRAKYPTKAQELNDKIAATYNSAPPPAN